jgi:hypothetical protein
LVVDFILDTGAPLTSMSERLYTRLLETGAVTRVGPNRYVLHDVSIELQEIGSLNIRGSNFLSRVDAEAVLGLDFFARFTEVRFHVPTGALTLEP